MRHTNTPKPPSTTIGRSAPRTINTPPVTAAAASTASSQAVPKVAGESPWDTGAPFGVIDTVNVANVV